jgi:hypothetical protein
METDCEHEIEIRNQAFPEPASCGKSGSIECFCSGDKVELDASMVLSLVRS